MSKENIIRKLTSRKLWIAVAGFVAGLIVAFDGSAETAETVSGLICLIYQPGLFRMALQALSQAIIPADNHPGVHVLSSRLLLRPPHH